MARVRAVRRSSSRADTHRSGSPRRRPPRRSISESIAMAEARTKEMGYKPVMDAGFAADPEEIIRNRKAREISTWD